MSNTNLIPSFEVERSLHINNANSMWGVLLGPDLHKEPQRLSPRMVILKGLFDGKDELVQNSHEDADSQNRDVEEFISLQSATMQKFGYCATSTTTGVPFFMIDTGPHTDWPSTREETVHNTVRIWRGNKTTEVGARSAIIKDTNQYNFMHYAIVQPNDGVMFISLSEAPDLPMCRHDFKRGKSNSDIICISRIVVASTSVVDFV